MDFQAALAKAKSIAEQLKSDHAKRPRPTEDDHAYKRQRDDYDDSRHDRSHDRRDDQYQSSHGRYDDRRGGDNRDSRYGGDRGDYQQGHSRQHQQDSGHFDDRRSDANTIMVPRAAVGFIIGRGGDTLRQIERETNTRLNFAPEDRNAPPTEERALHIQGVGRDANEARRVLLDKIEEAMSRRGGAGGRPGGNNAGQQFVMTVPANKVGIVLGRGASTVKDMSARSGARIYVVPENQDDAGPNLRSVKISGDENAIASAKKMIEELIFANADRQRDSYSSSHGHGSYNNDYQGGSSTGGGGGGGTVKQMEIPNDKSGAIIGRGGESIRNLQEITGCRIKMDPPSGGSYRLMTITGDRDSVAYAERLVNEKIDPDGHRSSNAVTDPYAYDYSAQQDYSGYQQAGGDQQAAYDYYANYYQQAAATGQPASQQGDGQNNQQAAYDYYANYYNQNAAGGDANATASGEADPNAYYAAYYQYYGQQGMGGQQQASTSHQDVDSAKSAPESEKDDKH